jgi:hypothetical protein
MSSHAMTPGSEAHAERLSRRVPHAALRCAALALGGGALMLVARALLGQALPHDTALSSGAMEIWRTWVAGSVTFWAGMIAVALPRVNHYARGQGASLSLGALTAGLLGMPFVAMRYSSAGSDYLEVRDAIQLSTNNINNIVTLMGLVVATLPAAVMFAATQQIEDDARSALSAAERATRYRQCVIETQREFRLLSTMIVLATLSTGALWKALKQADRIDPRVDGLAELFALQLTAVLCVVYIPIYLRQSEYGARLAQELGIEGSRDAAAKALGITGNDALEALATALAPVLAAAISGHV